MKLINKQQRKVCEALYSLWTKQLKAAYATPENAIERPNLISVAAQTERELIVAHHKLAQYENFEM